MCCDREGAESSDAEVQTSFAAKDKRGVRRRFGALPPSGEMAAGENGERRESALAIEQFVHSALAIGAAASGDERAERRIRLDTPLADD